MVLPLVCPASPNTVRHDPQTVIELMQCDPFDVMHLLPAFSFDELRLMYPRLSDHERTSLMIGILVSLGDDA